MHPQQDDFAQPHYRASRQMPHLAGLVLWLTFVVVPLLAPIDATAQATDEATAQGTDNPLQVPSLEDLMKAARAITDVDAADCGECHPDAGSSGHALLERLPHQMPADLEECGVCHEVRQEMSDADYAAGFARPSGEDAHLAMRHLQCADCHTHTPQDFEHEPVVNGECDKCHDPHDGRSGKAHLVKRIEADLCAECHEPESGRYMHVVMRRGSCGDCHRSHGSDQPGLVVGGGPSGSCPDCHTTESTPKAYPHDPVAKGECHECHDPHTSENKMLLVDTVDELCDHCHKTRIQDGIHLHSAVFLGRCDGCHNSHGSEHPVIMRNEVIGDSCIDCHPKVVAERRNMHAPVRDGQCTICHDPHSSDYAENLRSPVNVVCTACHPDKWRANAWFPHPAMFGDGCPACHDPHSSDNDFLLRKPQVDLCTGCHPDQEDGLHVERTADGKPHPLTELVENPPDGRERQCVSCHDPHGTDNPRLWYEAYSRKSLCVGCHRTTLAPGTEPGKSVYELDAEKAREREQKRRDAAAVEPQVEPPVEPPEPG